MRLTVHRMWFTEQSTQGQLDIDGIFFCYTLEPRKDQSKGKPYCIPLGTYSVKMAWSNHFQRITPHILGVPGFTAIEIHPGNFPCDTDACLMVGQFRHPDMVGNSDVTFRALMKELGNSNPVSITYQDVIST